MPSQRLFQLAVGSVGAAASAALRVGGPFVGSQVGADYDPKQSGSPWSYLALVMEARSKARVTPS